MTWLEGIDQSNGEVDAALGLLPDVREHVHNVLRLAWAINDPVLLRKCRLLSASMHGTRLVDAEGLQDEVAAVEDWRASTTLTPRERAALDYAEQFVIDQTTLGDAQKDELARHLDEREVVAFVQGLNINDAYIRILTLLDLPFDPAEDMPDAATAAAVAAAGREADESPEAPFSNSHYIVELSNPIYFEARLEHSRSANRHTRIDEVTSELIRLRNANHQRCEFCMSVRRAVLFPTAADSADPMDAVKMFESSDLPESQKAALRLADAFLAHPKGFGPEQRADVYAHYDSEQIMEILLKIMCWSQNRTPIALGFDAAVDAEQLTAFQYEKDGSFALAMGDG